MRTTFAAILLHVALGTILFLPASLLPGQYYTVPTTASPSSMPVRQPLYRGGYPDSVTQLPPEAAYLARHDMMPAAPSSAISGPSGTGTVTETGPTIGETQPEKPKSGFSSFFAKMLGPPRAGSDPLQYQQEQAARFQQSSAAQNPVTERSSVSPATQLQPPRTPRYRDAVDSPRPESETAISEAPADKAESGFFSSSKSSSKQNPLEDDGQVRIDELQKEQNFSEKDYVSSAIRNKSTASKELYDKGMRAESEGNTVSAVRHYNGFIKANKRQTTNGTLAAPYHRLALISWKNRKAKESDIYFRYAIKYARGGNTPIIAGDYGLFLMEQGKFPQAEIVLRNALLQSPENKRILLYLGRCSIRQHKPIEALRYLTTAVGEERAYLEVASIYREQGDFELARNMEQRREEYLARSVRPNVVGREYAGRHAPAGTPLTPPPVRSAPRGATAGSTAQFPVPSAMPFPTLHEMQPGAAAPTTVLPTDGWSAIPSAPATTMPETSVSRSDSALPGTPVSKVFHYPAGSMVPVYHQYSGNAFPGEATAGLLSGAPVDTPAGMFLPSDIDRKATETVHPPMTSELPGPPIPNAGRFGMMTPPGAESVW